MQATFAFLVLLPLVLGEQFGRLLENLPANVLSELVANDPVLAAAGMQAGGLLKTTFQEAEALVGGEVKDPKSEKSFLDPLSQFEGIAGQKTGKTLKVIPLKKVAVKKAAVGGKVLLPKGATAVKFKAAAALKKKPKVYSLKPIVHVVEKRVPVYHKVPIPKKILVPKFYPVKKIIPVPKIVPVPFKVPIKKIIPKIVKIPKAIPVPKFVPVKKPIPIAIPYPVKKFYKVPIPKPVPYAKYIPIPIPKKVPKFIPVPVKKIIKVPKPYYVPIKVPHVTTSYIKTPMKVQVPNVKKIPFKGKPSMKDFEGQSFMSFIPSGDKESFKMKDSDFMEGSDFMKLAENPEKLA